MLVLGLGNLSRLGFACIGGSGGKRGGTGHGSGGTGNTETRGSALTIGLLLAGFLGGLGISSRYVRLNRLRIVGLRNLSFGGLGLQLVSLGRLCSSHNRALLALRSLEQEALVGGLPIHSAQVGGVHLQALTQTRVQGNSRTVPGRAGLLSLGVQGRNGHKPVHAG